MTVKWQRYMGLGLCALGLAACAGSASESPWPVEPVNTEPGPAGEQPKEGVDVKQLPNRYGKTGDEEKSFEELDAAERAQREQDKEDEARDKARLERRHRERPGQDQSPMRPNRRMPMSP